jgi:hypothetical protein
VTAAVFDVPPRADATAAPAADGAPVATSPPSGPETTTSTSSTDLTSSTSSTAPTAPTTSTAPDVAALGAPPVSETAPAVRRTPIDLDLLLPMDAGTIVHLVDPCAVNGDGCPAGLAGTILSGSIEPLDITNVTTDVTPGRFALYDECARDHGAVGGNQAILAIISNHPATFTISGAWTGTASTSERQTARYESDRDRGNVHGVVACAAIEADRRGEIRIDGIDEHQQSAHLTRLVDARALSRKRPPVSVNPTGELTLQVFVPIRQNEQAQVVAFRRDPFATSAFNCGYALTGPGRPVDSTSTQSIVPIPATILEGSSQFDSAWNRVAVTNVRMTGPSVPYDLCVRWLSRARSFDSPQLIEAETRVVNPPAHPDIRVSVDGLFALRDQTIDVSHLTVEVKADERVPRCGLAPGFPLDVADHKYETPVRMCELHGGATGEWVTGVVTYYGHRVEQAIHLMTHQCRPGATGVCGDVVDRFAVDIPKPSGGPGAGFVELRFDYETPNGGNAPVGSYADTHWEIMGSIPAPVPGVDAPPLLTLLQPQLDVFGTMVRPEGGVEGRSILVVQWSADRAVDVVARVDFNNRSVCSRDPRPEVRSPATASSGTLRIEGLCAKTTSHVGLTLTDPATGQSSTYSDAEGVHADRVGPGFTATTSGIPVVYSPRLVASLHGTPPGTTIRMLRAFVWLNDTVPIEDDPDNEQPRFLLADLPRLEGVPCSSADTFSWAPDSFTSHNPDRPPTRPPTLTESWGEDVYLHVEVQVFVSVTPCGPGHRGFFHPQEMRRYDVMATTAGPSSVLASPQQTYGADLDTSGAPIYFGVRSIVVDLRARVG